MSDPKEPTNLNLLRSTKRKGEAIRKKRKLQSLSQVVDHLVDEAHTTEVKANEPSKD